MRARFASKCGTVIPVFASYCNPEIFARVLFLQNFAYAKSRENKILAKSQITLSFNDIDNSCPSRKFLTSQIYLLTLFGKI